MLIGFEAWGWYSCASIRRHRPADTEVSPGRQSKSGLPGRYEPFCWEGVVTMATSYQIAKTFPPSLFGSVFAHWKGQSLKPHEVAEGRLYVAVTA